MKIRQDFVTNSSSSSFIIAFSKIPENYEEIKKELFGDREFYKSSYGDESWETNMVAKTVFNDIKDQTPDVFEEIIESVKNGWFHGKEEMDYRKYSNKNGETDWDSFRKRLDELDEINSTKAEEIVDKFISENKYKYIYVVSYGDEDGSYYSALEHGDLFANIPHIEVSYH